MATEVKPREISSPEGERRPPYVLESGDRLSRAEFERRYEAMPDVKKAELIEGEVFVASPVRDEVHGHPHGMAMMWLGVYEVHTLGTRTSDNATVRLDADNEVQPDVLLRVLPELGGQVAETADGYLAGAPELVLEVAASSAAIDRHTKLHVYQRNGVREYIIWQVLDQQLEWFALREGVFEPLPPDAQGVVRSEVFPGLWLAVQALLAGDFAAVLGELQRGLDSAEHQAFVAELASRRTQPQT